MTQEELVRLVNDKYVKQEAAESLTSVIHSLQVALGLSYEQAKEAMKIIVKKNLKILEEM